MITPERFFTVVPQSIGKKIDSELKWVNEFTFAVAVILSAQATDKKVNEATIELFKIAPTPAKMLELGLDGLKKHIRVISFFNNKANNIMKLAAILADGQGDDWRFPKKYHNRDVLMQLPGVGQKTANVIMNILWGAPNIGVDTHVFRISHRFGWVDETDNTPEKVEEKLLKKIPKKYHAMANNALVLFGRYTCTALRQKCADCPIQKWCNAPDKNI